MSTLNKKVVYTALFGSYDELRSPNVFDPDCDFICFTDNENLTSTVWQIRYIEEAGMAPGLLNRKFKWLPHLYLPEYETSLYIDANVILKSRASLLMNACLGNGDLAMLRHAERNCLYQEGRAIIFYEKSKMIPVIQQVLAYRKTGYPSLLGLTENRVIFRRHNEKHLIEIMEAVWVDINKWRTGRDQLSFPYVAWLNTVDINFLDTKDFYEKSFHKNENIKKKIVQKINTFIARKLSARVYDLVFFLISGGVKK